MGPSSGAPTPPNTIRAPPIGPCGTPKRRRYFANRLPLPAGVSKLILQRGPKPPKVLSNEVPNDPLIFQQCPKPRKWFSNSAQNTHKTQGFGIPAPATLHRCIFQRLLAQCFREFTPRSRPQTGDAPGTHRHPEQTPRPTMHRDTEKLYSRRIPSGPNAIDGTRSTINTPGYLAGPGHLLNFGHDYRFQRPPSAHAHARDASSGRNHPHQQNPNPTRSLIPKLNRKSPDPASPRSPPRPTTRPSHPYPFLRASPSPNDFLTSLTGEAQKSRYFDQKP